MGTAGLVANFGPMSDGERPLVGGFTRELIETLYARDHLGPDVTPKYWMSDYNRKIQFKPEGLKRLLDEFCVNAGVDVLFFTRLVAADAAGPSRQRRRSWRMSKGSPSSRPRRSSMRPAMRCWPMPPARRA